MLPIAPVHAQGEDYNVPLLYWLLQVHSGYRLSKLKKQVRDNAFQRERSRF